eukprot:RCo031719
MPRCPSSFPIVAVFVIIVLGISGGLTASLWVPFNAAAMSSVDGVASTLYRVEMQSLQQRITCIFATMATILQTWGSLDVSTLSDFSAMSRYVWIVLQAAQDGWAVQIASPTGETVGSVRLAPGHVVLMRQHAFPPNTTSNLTYWTMFPNATEDQMYASIPFDARARPWYINAVKSGLLAFTSPFVSNIHASQVLAASMPLYDSAGVLQFVIALSYPFATFTAALQAAHSAMETSGAFMLFDAQTRPVAVASSSPVTLDGDIEEVQRFLHEHSEGNQTSLSASFRTFGSSRVLVIPLTEDYINGVPTFGVKWKLVMVLPLRDYYSQIWTLNRVTAGIVAGVLVASVLCFLLAVHFLITRPLSSLTAQLRRLSTALRGLQGDPGRSIQW